MPRNISGGMIYAIGAQGTAMIKIGSTRTAVDKRLKVLQTGQPFSLVHLASIPVEADLRRIEHQIHQFLVEEHRRGEWFEGEMDAARLEALVLRAIRHLAESEAQRQAYLTERALAKKEFAMPRVKTGKAYEVLNCRVPPGLIARLSAHAELHSQRVRDVVAAALLAYLDGTHVAPVETHAAQVVRQAQKHIADGLKLLGTVVQAPRRAPAGVPAASVTPQPDNNGVDVTPQPDTPAYDTTKFYLGKLCPRAHDWHSTGKTLRRIQGNKCDLCENEGKRKRREVTRQAQASPLEEL